MSMPNHEIGKHSMVTKTFVECKFRPFQSERSLVELGTVGALETLCSHKPSIPVK